MLNFGYTLCEGEEEKETQLYQITAASFDKNGRKLLRAMDRIFPDRNVLKVLFEENDYVSGLAQMLEQKVAENGVPVKRFITDEGVWYYFN
jgi:hypothetical protein